MYPQKQYTLDYIEDGSVLYVRIGALNSHSQISAFFDEYEAILSSQTPGTRFSTLFDALDSSNVWSPNLRRRIEQLNRVAFSRNLWTRAAVLLADSPTSNLMKDLLLLTIRLLIHRRVEIGIFADRDQALAWLRQPLPKQ
ncbi:MAG: hypothetical protein HZC41_26380 [Chloroflexi bacterium]|nr:hypothetical protein [Chloroflexota bacterium]